MKCCVKIIKCSIYLRKILNILQHLLIVVYINLGLKQQPRATKRSISEKEQCILKCVFLIDYISKKDYVINLNLIEILKKNLHFIQTLKHKFTFLWNISSFNNKYDLFLIYYFNEFIVSNFTFVENGCVFCEKW